MGRSDRQLLQCVCVFFKDLYVYETLFSYFSFLIVMNVKMKFEDFMYAFKCVYRIL